ncbi:hypothetical protein MuYL_3953 [Mucilaginibacter xinganensis]|uniref:Uncharacterized protein n=2 Tax=Mucilaginibacter xinganensis TaxID=1234841 RepID=A0A223P1Y9_9SPHI|nr:hypothetical protein MuYL_3953 [Mucilaginibacter xinganensis]
MATSITFIRNNALLTRKFVEDNNLPQTVQNSDPIDKEYGLWDDIFLDGLDLHQHFNRNSPYGPIMFKIDLKILTLPDFQNVYITKDNPTNWRSKPNWDDRYYKNIEEFAKDYRNSGRVRDGQIMFTFKNCSDKIKLNKFCREIIVDNPHILLKDNIRSLGTLALSKIVSELSSNKLSHIPVTLRHNENTLPFCWCVKNYGQMQLFNKSELILRFSSNI